MFAGERGISAHETNMSVCRSRCRPSAIRRPLSSSKRANQIAADFVNGLLRVRRLWLAVSTLQNLLWQLVTPDFLRNTPFRPEVAYGPACDALDDVKTQRDEVELEIC